ncbi:MAG TPA: DUF6634 family protein [Methylosinus sp.]|jgi:hypothetical protein|uniref:DUF6634 family protein n=1 Tax=Methylosinus sp. TaxID=427 RepID=UPI002F946165
MAPDADRSWSMSRGATTVIFFEHGGFIMRSAIFLGDDPKQIIRRTRALSDDIACILADGAPAESDLAEAPILDHWVVIGRMTPALAGAVTGHPALGDRSIITSDLCALDAAAGWARTESRFYRLGRPGGGARGRDQ